MSTPKFLVASSVWQFEELLLDTLCPKIKLYKSTIINSNVHILKLFHSNILQLVPGKGWGREWAQGIASLGKQDRSLTIE